MPWQLSSWGRTARGGLHHLVSEAACQKLTHQHGWSDSRHLGKCHPSQDPGPRTQDQEQGSQNKTTLANKGLSASNSSPAPGWLSRLGTCCLLPGERSCKAICSALPPPVPHKALSQLDAGRKTRTDITTADTHKPRTRGTAGAARATQPYEAGGWRLFLAEIRSFEFLSSLLPCLGFVAQPKVLYLSPNSFSTVL